MEKERMMLIVVAAVAVVAIVAIVLSSGGPKSFASPTGNMIAYCNNIAGTWKYGSDGQECGMQSCDIWFLGRWTQGNFYACN